jgi:hypothetical protein
VSSIHVLIGMSIDSLLHPATPYHWSANVHRQINEAMRTELITIEEFHYYTGRLTQALDGRREVA